MVQTARLPEKIVEHKMRALSISTNLV